MNIKKISDKLHSSDPIRTPFYELYFDQKESIPELYGKIAIKALSEHETVSQMLGEIIIIGPYQSHPLDIEIGDKIWCDKADCLEAHYPKGANYILKLSDVLTIFKKKNIL